jgi:hypothetical protein
MLDYPDLLGRKDTSDGFEISCYAGNAGFYIWRNEYRIPHVGTHLDSSLYRIFVYDFSSKIPGYLLNIFLKSFPFLPFSFPLPPFSLPLCHMFPIVTETLHYFNLPGFGVPIPTK